MSYQMTSKNCIHSFPAWVQNKRDSVKNKLTSLVVVSLGKTFDFMWQTGGGAKLSTLHGDPV